MRKAFAQAIDRERLAEVVVLGTATAAKGILPPEMPGYDPDWPGLIYDPVAAREALAHSSYGGPEDLPELVLATSGSTGVMGDTTRAILAMLEENLGVAVRVEQIEWAYFLQDLNQQRYQMYSSGWIADYPDPQNFLDVLFHSASPQNHNGYANAEVDSLLERARVEQDEAQREALYRQAERLIVEDAPWVPLTPWPESQPGKRTRTGVSTLSRAIPVATGRLAGARIAARPQTRNLKFSEGEVGRSMAPMLQVRNLTTEFHTQDGIVHAVNGIDFELDEGRNTRHRGRKWLGQEREHAFDDGASFRSRLARSPPARCSLRARTCSSSATSRYAESAATRSP